MPDILTAIESADRILRRVEDAVTWAWRQGVRAQREIQRARMNKAAAALWKRSHASRLTTKDFREAMAAVAAEGRERR